MTPSLRVVVLARRRHPKVIRRARARIARRTVQVDGRVPAARHSCPLHHVIWAFTCLAHEVKLF
jgi:fructose-1,6-bisphosphatase/sedoheptulose 1,7-bisphosphatase-like protein